MCRRVEVEVEVEYYRTCSVCSLCARRGLVCLKIIERSFLIFFFHLHAVNSLQLLLSSLSNETAVHIIGCALISYANFAFFRPVNRTRAHVHKQAWGFFFPS